MFQAAVDCLGRPVGGAGLVEEREHVFGAALQGPSEGDEFCQRGGDAVAEGVDERLHHRASVGAVGVAVGGDHGLVDGPGCFNLDVLIDGEQGVQSCTLFVGEERLTGVEGAAGSIERVTGSSAMPASVLLDALSASVQGVARQSHDVEGVHHCHRVGKLLSGGGLEPGESVHRDDLDGVSPGLGAAREPLFERLLRAALDHVQQACRAGLVSGGGEVDDHGDVLVAPAGVTPHVFVHSDHRDAVETGGVINQHPAAFTEDRSIRGVPRHPEPGGDTRHGQVIHHDAFQCPPQTTVGDLRPRPRSRARVLPLCSLTPGAPVAAHPHQQHRRPMPGRFMCKPTSDGIPRHALRTAPATPVVAVTVHDAALQHSPIRLELLPDGFETELLKAAECGQIRGGEGSVGHVEVFQIGGVRTPILGGPRPLPSHRRAHPNYTLDCGEPHSGIRSWLRIDPEPHVRVFRPGGYICGADSVHLRERDLLSNMGTGIALSTVVMAHPRRAEPAEKIRELHQDLNIAVVLDPEPDGPPSAWRTARRAWSSIAVGATHHLVIQDDVALASDFSRRVMEAIAARPNDPLCLFVEWGSRTSNATRIAASQAVSWAPVVDDYIPCQALVLPVALAAGFDDFAGRTSTHEDPDDVVLLNYLRSLNIVALAAVENLVQHDGTESLVGNSIMGSRRSVNFVSESERAVDGSVLEGLAAVPYYDWWDQQAAMFVPSDLSADGWERLRSRPALALLGVSPELVSESLELHAPSFPNLERLGDRVSDIILKEIWTTAYMLGFVSRGQGPIDDASDNAALMATLSTVAPGGLRRITPEKWLADTQELLAPVVVAGFGAGCRQYEDRKAPAPRVLVTDA